MTSSRHYDCSDPDQRAVGMDAAVRCLGSGGLVVLPTDTVYGIGADAFDPQAVASLLAAKGRGRDFPPPVLISGPQVMDALAVDVPAPARALAEAFWPGALTIILLAQPALRWDLGETDGTAALRMPDDPTALELLGRTGPLAVSSANRHGEPAALTCGEARDQLGESVGVYLDGGPVRGGESSTIVDATAQRLTIVRQGALSRERLAEVAPELGRGAR